MTQQVIAATPLGDPINNPVNSPASATALNLEPLIRPDVIGWWPLSLGAWLTIAASVIAISLLLWLASKTIRRWHHLRRQQQRATKQLIKLCADYRHATQDLTAEQCFNSGASEQLCQGINIVCKQHLLAITQHYFDANQNAYREIVQQKICLTGIDWAELVTDFESSSRSWNGKQRPPLLNDRLLNIIAQGPYRPAQQLPVDCLQTAVSRWLTQITPRRIKQVFHPQITTVIQEAS